MANATWPTSLPSYVLEQGYQENLPDNNVYSSVSTGPNKVRRRFTGNTQKFVVSVQMSAEQSETFEDFFNTTLGNGSLPFDWLHPRKRTAVSYQFASPAPAAVTQGGVNVVWTLNLQLLSSNT